MTDFIEVYPGALDPDLCRAIIERFEASGQATRGKTGAGVDTRLKDSYDIPITGRPEWEDVVGMIQQAAFAGLRRYVRAHPFALIAPLAMRYQDPATGEVRLVTEPAFASLPDDQLVPMLQVAFRPGSINLQKYLAGVGGYPYWHSEVYPRDADCDTLHRVLLYSIYLNDVPEAGETEFFYQKRKIAPQNGSLLIAPAGFTHTHRGNTPVGGDKYIATSWVLFQRAEDLYPGRAPP
ncbi:MAG TPA: 2OG-Fe(II) oxygenase [Gemmataceae bacterium]|nr:2OG-Fe(II) oxygenase [Gemmataceae bacterium]